MAAFPTFVRAGCTHSYAAGAGGGAAARAAAAAGGRWRGGDGGGAHATLRGCFGALLAVALEPKNPVANSHCPLFHLWVLKINRGSIRGTKRGQAIFETAR